MIELELKAVVADAHALSACLVASGAREEFIGRMVDYRLDFADKSLSLRDEVVRVREYRDRSGKASASLDWKGPAAIEDGYKRREEITVTAGDGPTLLDILGRIGLRVAYTIDREIEQFTLDGATVRLERYERMDDLVEVEGDPAAIERAIARIGIPRAAFSSESLTAFVARYVARTGNSAITGSRTGGGEPGT